LTTDWLEEAKDVAAVVARSVHRKYLTYFDVDDLRQDLLVWVLRREEKVIEWLVHEDKEEHDVGVRMLARALQRQADKYCRSKKAQALGYQLEDEAYYSPIVLSELLPFVWADVVDTRDGSKPKVSGGGNPAEGGTYIIQLFDIRRGLEKLDPNDRLILQMKFYEQMTFADIATTLDISDTTAHRKVDGALRRLNRHLGGQSPFQKEEII
jgi:RNA polymerase sigma factor (sigma-70 family)